jgi:hypothetical protein
MAMNYKDLSNEDKIAAIMEERFERNEREHIDQYLEALKMNNRAEIEKFESLGDSPSQICTNQKHFARAFSAFGFTNCTINKYGWAEREEFLDCEIFSFGRFSKGNMGENTLHHRPGAEREMDIRTEPRHINYGHGLLAVGV